jgi:uncharacterized damage-inducible protein DinB
VSDQREPYTLADAWHLNNRVNLMLLDQLDEEQLAVTANPRARNVAEQFAHMHAVRIMWLEPRTPALAKALPKIAKGEASKAAIKEALEASAAAIGDLFAEGEKTGKVKIYFKRGPIAFFAYAMAHEAHHRAQIVLHLKYAGRPVDRAFGFSLWEWDKI